MHLLPQSLLWRTFLLIAGLMVLAVMAWAAIFARAEREPRAREQGWDSGSAAVVAGQGGFRRGFVNPPEFLQEPRRQGRLVAGEQQDAA